MPVFACYPGSFDPVTFGHLDLIRRAARLFDRVVVAIGVNASKAPLFTPEERRAMIEAELGELSSKVEVATFRGLVVEFCRARGITVLLRGLRTVSDFESELQMALTNRSFAPEIESVFMMPAERYAFVSSRLIKEVVNAGGSVESFVPGRVAEALRARLGIQGGEARP